MKKVETYRDTLRPEYRQSDFPGGLVRDKYSKRVVEGANLVRLDPEIAAAFPTSEAVNAALAGLLRKASPANSTQMAGRRSRSKVAR